MSDVVVVTGATGQQGGAVARTLVDGGVAVRALVRDPDSARARALGSGGATLVRGDLDDPASLRAALDGARSVFSVQTPDLADLMGDTEERHARHLAAAAADAGVEQIVHTSVSGAGRAEPVDEQRHGAFVGHYWRSKAAAERAVRESGVPRWTILRPGMFMENLLPPAFQFPDAAAGRLLVAVDPDVPIGFVAVADIGAAGAAAITDPERFDRVELELAGDLLTFRTVAAILSEILGHPVTLPGGPEQARAAGLPEEFVLAQRFTGEHPAPARPEDARALGLPTTAFADWARARFRET